jgi:hypothetical protein
MNITVTETLNEDTLDVIRQGLRAHNSPYVDPSLRKPLGIYAQGAAGQVVAGLTGETWGNWLSVEWLWVADSQRGSGLGRKVLLRRNGRRKHAAAAMFVWIPLVFRRGRSTKNSVINCR